jgi:hypothetical protein
MYGGNLSRYTFASPLLTQSINFHITVVPLTHSREKIMTLGLQK